MSPAVSLEDLQETLGHRFSDEGLLRTALTHRSAVSELLAPESYERLEFLGDAVLGLVCTVWLYERRPEAPEGELTRRKSRLVSMAALAGYARELGLGDYLVLGQGEERTGGREKPSLLADAVEAILGALYLDGGLPAAEPVVHRLLEGAPRSPLSRRGALVEAKNRLQEIVQARGEALPPVPGRVRVGPRSRQALRDRRDRERRERRPRPRPQQEGR